MPGDVSRSRDSASHRHRSREWRNSFPEREAVQARCRAKRGGGAVQPRKALFAPRDARSSREAAPAVSGQPLRLARSAREPPPPDCCAVPGRSFVRRANTLDDSDRLRLLRRTPIDHGGAELLPGGAKRATTGCRVNESVCCGQWASRTPGDRRGWLVDRRTLTDPAVSSLLSPYSSLLLFPTLSPRGHKPSLLRIRSAAANG